MISRREGVAKAAEGKWCPGEIPHWVSKYLLGLLFLQCGCYRYPDSYPSSRETPEPIFAGFSDALRNVKRPRQLALHTLNGVPV